jgi:hypothetical protein
MSTGRLYPLGAHNFLDSHLSFFLTLFTEYANYFTHEYANSSTTQVPTVRSPAKLPFYFYRFQRFLVALAS